MFSSIKLKLITWTVLTLAGLFLTLGLYLRHELEEIIIGSVDSHLHSEVQLLASLIESEEGEEMEISEAETGEYSLPLSGHYYQIVSPEGKVISRSPSLSIVDALLPLVEGNSSAELKEIIGPGKNRLRMLSQRFNTASGEVIIQAAETLEEPYHLIDEFQGTLYLIFPATLILATIGIIIISASALSRLDRFSEKVGHITEKRLNERLEDKGLEAELMPLARGFNEMMDRLELSFKKQGQFLSDASHDLRTPTSVIKSHCDVILKKSRSPEEYIEALQKIKNSSERMSGIIDRIIEVARLDSSQFKLKHDNVDLMELLENVVTLLAPKAKEKGISISINGEAIRFNGDRERLFEAFSDIIDNAIKYNKENGSVDVTLNKREASVELAITDKGIGIALEEQAKIFDRFYRVDSSRGLTSGSGLGLSITKAIVEAHGGKIELESSPGEGSCFTVILPI